MKINDYIVEAYQKLLPEEGTVFLFRNKTKDSWEPFYELQVANIGEKFVKVGTSLALSKLSLEELAKQHTNIFDGEAIENRMGLVVSEAGYSQNNVRRILEHYALRSATITALDEMKQTTVFTTTQ